MTSPSTRALLPALLASLVLAGVVAALRLSSPTPVPPRAPSSPEGTGPDAGVLLTPDLRWLAVGGGADPESTQVSLEQDLSLAREVLGGDGLVFFAGGSASPSVQVQDEGARGDSLRAQLALLLDPRPGRGTHYRAPSLAVDAEGSAENTLTVLEELLDLSTSPLLMLIVGHGEGGETPADGRVHLWGGRPLGVRDLAGVLDASGGARPLRLVMATCYGGGFADLAFHGASPDEGSAASPRCGLFAAPWDDEASGCDPNPERGEQESYTLHFLHALAGRDRDGRTLPRAALDLDGDGRVSLLEAHTRARVASRSIDVPTTTSERWLRAVAPAEGPEAALPFPEEEAVIASLGDARGLAGEAEARARLEAVDDALAAQAEALDEAQRVEDDAFHALRIALLSRWPVLDDPWHPDFEASFASARSEVARVLDASPEAVEHARASLDLQRREERYDRLRGERALLARLVRAHETLRLARRLTAQGGAALSHYQALLSCERGPP